MNDIIKSALEDLLVIKKRLLRKRLLCENHCLTEMYRIERLCFTDLQKKLAEEINEILLKEFDPIVKGVLTIELEIEGGEGNVYRIFDHSTDTSRAFVFNLEKGWLNLDEQIVNSNWDSFTDILNTYFQTTNRSTIIRRFMFQKRKCRQKAMMSAYLHREDRVYKLKELIMETWYEENTPKVGEVAYDICGEILGKIIEITEDGVYKIDAGFGTGFSKEVYPKTNFRKSAIGEATEKILKATLVSDLLDVARKFNLKML